MTRKRAPGGGRKPQGRVSGLSGTPVNLRMPTDLRNQLVAAAADSGNSLTQEVLDRLQWSLDKDRELDRDPASYSLSYLLGEVIKNAKATVRPRKWRSDPFAWRVVRLTFDKILDALAPPGEIRLPPPEEDRPRDFPEMMSRWPNYPARYGDTPEEVADFLSRTIMFIFENHETMPLSERERGGHPTRWHALKYGMADAGSNLAIKKEEKGR
jgi:hypothetical protein